MSAVEIVELDAAGVAAAIGELSAVLADCVNGGASVNFMLPYGPDDAASFFRKVIAGIEAGDIVLLAAKLDGRIVGTVQLGMDTPRTSRIAARSGNCSCTAMRAMRASARR